MHIAASGDPLDRWPTADDCGRSVVIVAGQEAPGGRTDRSKWSSTPHDATALSTPWPSPSLTANRPKCRFSLVPQSLDAVDLDSKQLLNADLGFNAFGRAGHAGNDPNVQLLA